MSRYWIYIDSKIQGPFEVNSLRRAAGFNLLTQVCLEGQKTWSLADDVLEIKSYFLSPPRVSSLALEVGNTALNVEVETAASPHTQSSPLAVLSMGDNLVEELPPLKAGSSIGKKEGAAQTSPAAAELKPGSLRALCDVCGYKNPRDVSLCMKCGTPIAAVKTDPVPETADTLVDKKSADAAVATVTPEPITPILEHKIIAASPLRGLWMGVVVGLLALGGFFGARSWKKHQTLKNAHAIPVLQIPAESVMHESVRHSSGNRSRRAHRVTTPPSGVEQLPGVVASPEESHARHHKAIPPVDATEPPEAYHVIAEATPLKHRESSPIDSPYAQKRRSDKTLWNAQQEQATRQVQRTRIYGGQRTVQRNVEILMQLLRDREYNTAFETGRRPYLYNDLDWSASIKDSPVYEVRLTFSGGREDDGTPRKALRFAFNADLERGTVEPGGDEGTRNNTLHAFFDESRIPPEERRPIAKDVEELVMAADPSASPLALDTVVRNFAATYNVAALERVARAFDLDTVKKKLKHEPQLGKALSTNSDSVKEPVIFEQMEHMNTAKARVPSASDAPTPDETKASAPVPTPQAAMKGDFTLEHGSGHDRILQAQVASKAAPDRLWEALTSYDRFKLFVPDVLESEREGQDGSAIIVHTVSLSHWAFFVFKINLHLRIIERPAQKVIEFERIAGDFETFRGSFEIQSDPQSKQSTLIFHSTLAPKGKMPDWMLSGMAKRFILPKLVAFCARAEAN